MTIFIYLNILVGILFLMKLIIMKMKLMKLMVLKFLFLQDLRVEWVEEESYFFKLSKWQNKLLKYFDKNPEFILS